MTAVYSKSRLGILSIFFVMTFVLFFARLLYIQVVRGDDFRERARRQYMEGIELPALRGEIFDTKGNKIAGNSRFNSLCVYPLSYEDLDRVYIRLVQVLGEKESTLRQKFNLMPKQFAWIKRGLTPAEEARFAQDTTTCGVFVREEPTRSYPYGEIGRAIVGFTDIDNRGKAGIELSLDDRLTGVTGRSLILKDGKGKGYVIDEKAVQEPISGRSVILTIDWDKQQVVEEELARAVHQYKAKGGTAIFIDPHSGAIIAAADYVPKEGKPSRPVKLEAIANTYEPGSVFKIVTAAAALEEGGVTPYDQVYAENGKWKLGKNLLRDDHKHGWLSFQEAFEKSSNIAMGKIANQIGPEKVFAMAERMGFGRRTRCGLQGEAKGMLYRPRKWSIYTASAFAIGHGVSVTPLQMAQTFATVAAGGYMYAPHFVKGYVDPDGQIVMHQSKPVKVLNDKTCELLNAFMQGVVEKGTATPIADAPFKIAGKTGTAEKPNFETGGYYKNRFMASFGGYFPADSPKVAGIVVLDEPEPIHYGGYTSAPAFKNIAIKIAAIDKYDFTAGARYQIDSIHADSAREGSGLMFVSAPGSAAMPESMELDDGEMVDDSEYLVLPELIGLTRMEASRLIDRLGLEIVFSGAGDTVLLSRPASFSQIPEGGALMCYMTPGYAGVSEVPDLLGLTIREAVALLNRYGIRHACEGAGRAVMQYPMAGARLEPGDVVHVTFTRNEGV